MKLIVGHSFIWLAIWLTTSETSMTALIAELALWALFTLLLIGTLSLVIRKDAHNLGLIAPALFTVYAVVLYRLDLWALSLILASIVLLRVFAERYRVVSPERR